MRRRFLVASAAALLVALLISSAAAQSAPLEVHARDVSFGSDGVTHVTVSVTGGSIGTSTLSASNFVVTEQGAPVTGLTVQPLFQNQTTAVSVALIFDVSGSTIGAAHAAAQAAAKQLVDSLPQHVQIELISFSDTANVRQGFTTDKGAVKRAIDALAAGGGTALYDAVFLGANELKRQVNGQHNIVLFTDGDDTASKATLASAENAVRDANAPTIGVLLKTAQVNGAALKAITQSVKGGKFLQVTDRSQLASTFQQASQSIASQYILSYPSTATTPKQLNLVVTASFGGQSASDSSVVLNGRSSPTGPGVSGPVAATPQKPIVGFFGNRIGLYLGIAAAFLGVLLFVGMLLYRPAGKTAERMLQRRLRLYTRGRDKKKDQPQSQSESGLLGGTAIGRRAVEIAERVPRSKQFDERLQKQLDQAGWLLRSTEFLMLQVGGFIVGLVVGWGLLGKLWLGAILAVVGVAAPQLLLVSRMQKRTSDFLSQLPDTLQLLAGSLQAGYGFMQALDTVAKEAAVPTSLEFARVLSESRLGMPVEDALEAMSDRVGGEDFKWVVMAINIQRQVGGNLATLLTTVSNTLREREQVRRQIKVLSAEGRLSAIILIALPFLLVGYLSFANPSYLHQLTSNTVGKIAMLVSLGLIGVGAIWMRKIIKIDV